MLQTLLFGFTFISPPFLKKWVLRLAGAAIHPKASIGWFSAISARKIVIEEHAVIRPLTLIRIDGELMLRSYSEISSFILMYGSSDFYLGKGSYIGPQSLINVDEPVQIGNRSALGARCMVFTHGSFFPFTEGYWVKHAGVTLEDNVWCAAGVFLHPGSHISENTFVNSMSVVSGEIPPGSIAEGNPAKVVHQMARLKRNMSPQQVDVALEKILRDFSEVILKREFRIDNFKLIRRCLEFAWHGRHYSIQIIPSTGNFEKSSSPENVVEIYLVNCDGWQPPEGAYVLDIPKGQTQYSRELFHSALRLFLLRYYGVRLYDIV